MNAPLKHLSSDVQMRVSATGKVHLPTSVRAQLGLEEGGVLIAKNENGKLWLTSLRQEMIAMREELYPYFQDDSVDAFLADRREDAAREAKGH